MIDDDRSLSDLKVYAKQNDNQCDNLAPDKIQVGDYKFKISPNYIAAVNSIFQSTSLNDLMYGKDKTERVVSIHVKDDYLWLFLNDGEVLKIKNTYWIASSYPIPGSSKLDGDLFYKYIKSYDTREEYVKEKSKYYKKRIPIFSLGNQEEMAMIFHGITLFKGLNVKDISVLSFDIEAAGLAHDDNSETFMISSTFRNRHGKIIKKVFRQDHYGSDVEMTLAWCEWVRTVDPDFLIGHNVFGYDLPYMQYCLDREGEKLYLGRDGSEVEFAKRMQDFRVDGSQSWTYQNARIFGRQVIDTSFLAVKYDFKRNYPSWALKSIIEHEGLVKKDRQFYDASKIGMDWKDLEKRELIVQYGADDSDDALALFDLMIPSYFYYAQYIPKTLQSIINSATGSQINAFLVRAYIQNGHSIPQASEAQQYEGAISFGNPGVWEHVNKVDVASLYPSIMIEHKVYDKEKDPKGYFLKMVETFTKERLENKRLGRETGDRHYKDIEQAQKIVINSAYGMMGAPGLLFNSPKNAAFVTAQGREILQTGINWAEGKGYQIVNVDTDSFSYTTGKRVPVDIFEEEIVELNTLFPKNIIWENDDQFKRFVVCKAKNYYMVPYDKKASPITKGSALKATTKEKALKEFINNVLVLLASKKKDRVYTLYNEYVTEIVTDDFNINRWSSKKTVSKAVLNPARTNEQKILDAIGDKPVQEGDKIYVYFDRDDNVKLEENWNNDHNIGKLLSKLYKTLEVFGEVIDVGCFPNYSLARNKDLLDSL